MKYLLLLLICGTGMGCTTVGEGQARLIYSEAGGFVDVFSGRVSSCTFINGKDSKVVLTKMEFDPSANKCSAIVATE